MGYYFLIDRITKRVMASIDGSSIEGYPMADNIDGVEVSKEDYDKFLSTKPETHCVTYDTTASVIPTMDTPVGGVQTIKGLDDLIGLIKLEDTDIISWVEKQCADQKTLNILIALIVRCLIYLLSKDLKV